MKDGGQAKILKTAKNILKTTEKAHAKDKMTEKEPSDKKIKTRHHHQSN